MGRRYINQLGEHENLHEVFLVGNKQLRHNRNGNLYLQMRLSDRTGAVTAMMWNTSDHVASAFENGDYVEIQGTTQFYNGAMQIIVTRVDRAEPGSVNEEEFVHFSQQHVDQLRVDMVALLRSMENSALRDLAECFLSDEDLMGRMSRAPAAVKHHHAFHGGLIEHVVSLMKLVDVVAERYPQLDRDILLMGAFLHDIGKVDELTYERDLAYSTEGQLVGHLVMGVTMLDAKLNQYRQMVGDNFPAETAVLLKHMIVSHHGKLEFGSPKVPMTREAIALHVLDDLDAKLHNFDQITREDVNVDSEWTAFQAHLGRKLYKGPAE